MRSRAYLDWASAAPTHPKAARAFARALRWYGNPSSPHEEGRSARAVLEDSRRGIARLAGVKPSAVIFTSGATEANALAIQGRLKRCAEDGIQCRDMHVLYLPTMHSSALKTVQEFQAQGVSIEPLRLTGGAIDLETFKMQLRPETVLVCVDAVCGETGSRFETLRMRRVIDAVPNSQKALLHVDASQLPLVESIEHTRLGADSTTLDAQKVGGIRGIGALVLAQPNAIGKIIAPLMQGGGQEGGLRPGTEPVALAVAFAAALIECEAKREAFATRAARVRKELVRLMSDQFPALLVNESPRQAPHILNVSLPGLDTDYAIALLDADGVAVSTKSACETDSEDGSAVVYALTGDAERSKATLRISWGPQTSLRDIRRFVKAFARTIRFLAVR